MQTKIIRTLPSNASQTELLLAQLVELQRVNNAMVFKLLPVGPAHYTPYEGNVNLTYNGTADYWELTVGIQ